MIGFHCPIIKGSFKRTIEEPHNISNINAFQIFLRNPRQLRIVKYKEAEALECKKYVIKNNLFLVSHASYLLNTATEDKREDKINSALNDLIYAEKAGAVGSVFHVGKHLKLPIETGLQNMYNFISEVIEKLQEDNIKSIYILETSASSGTELLSNIVDLGAFYHRFSNKQQKNLKICIDTCHTFASGYSLKSEQDAINFIKLVEDNIIWKNVIVIHLNDSKKDCGSKVDRHENLCKGFIGKDDDSGFRYFVNFCASKNIPMILETPLDEHNIYEIHKEELKMMREWI